MKRTPLHIKGHSSTAQVKNEIQSVVREIVIKRDGGCILREIRHCGGEAGMEGVVLQADHLITRSNSATYASTRLIVCVCRPCHFWKKYHKEEYDELVKSQMTPVGRHLWEKCKQDSWRPKRTGAYDWKLEIVALKRELKSYE